MFSRVSSFVVAAGALAAVGALAPAASAGVAAPLATAANVSTSGPSVPDGPVTCGQSISSPGTYFLAADCSGSGITISSSNVTLFLNGHTITGPGIGSGNVGVFVDDSAGPVSSVRVKGPGTVTGYFFNVDLGVGGGPGVSNSAVSYVSTPGGQQGVTISNAEGGGNSIIGNNASSDTVAGIADFGTGNLFTQNTADTNGAYGIAIIGTGETISNNAAEGNASDLVDFNTGCDSNVWRHNTFTTANQSCIH